MFVSLVGPPLYVWNPEPNDHGWLQGGVMRQQRTAQTAENRRLIQNGHTVYVAVVLIALCLLNPELCINRTVQQGK